MTIAKIVLLVFSLFAKREESLFPPRCCKRLISLAAADVFFSSNFIKHFEEKSVEFSTVNRVYCAWPICSAFVPPSHIKGDTGVCPTCGFWVCTICNGPPHHGQVCPEDTALSSLIQTAKQAGRQRSYRCRRVVQLAHGCNHMTCVRPCPPWLCMPNFIRSCLCGAEFCYICARQWRTCHCDQWDERRLLDLANQVADRAAAELQAQPREAFVLRIQDYLLDRHDCNHECINHEYGQRIGEERHCEFCGEDFLHFIYACDRCATFFCSFCRHHRT